MASGWVIEPFEGLPNVLEEERFAFLARQQLVPYQFNDLDLLKQEQFPYSVDKTLLQEWIVILRRICDYWTARHIPGRRKEWGRDLQALIAPLITIGYAEGEGELLLRRLAMGLARTLKADFLAVDVRELNRVTRQLEWWVTGEMDEEEEILVAEETIMDDWPSRIDQKSRPSMRALNLKGPPPSNQHSTMESTDFAKLSDSPTTNNQILSNFLKTRISKADRKAGMEMQRLAQSLASRPLVTTLEYLEYCMKRRNAATSPTPWRVIFLSCRHDPGALHTPNVKHSLRRMMAAREALGEKTVFILSNATLPSPSGPGMSRGEVESDSHDYFNGQDVMMDGPERDQDLDRLFTGSSSPSKDRRHSRRAFSEEDGKLEASFSPPPSTLGFQWLIDPKLRGPCFLIPPPLDPHNLLQHRHQIRVDRRLLTLLENYRRLKVVLDGLAESHRPYSALLSALPPHDPDLVWDIIRLAAPALQETLLSSAELLTICLRMNLRGEDEAIPSQETSLTILGEAVEQFFASRHAQRAINGGESPEGRSVPFASLTKHERRLLPNIVTPAMVNTRFCDIGALCQVKRTLEELISLRVQRPDLFRRGILREAISGILLFGPPGTGKSMLARAVAAQSGATFISATSSSIFDMYVGEGEKNVRALFSLARRLAPSVIFIDEVDALLEARSSSLGRASRIEVVNEFMAEWDGLLSQHNQGVTVMAATNRPFVLDDAVLRRLPRRILVDLPDRQGRLEILKLLLREDHLAPCVDLVSLASITDHYSGSDLKNVCMAAALYALRRARQQQQDPSTNSTNCDQEITGADFVAALQDVPASLSDRMSTLIELRQWDREYGEGRSGRDPSKPISTVGF